MIELLEPILPVLIVLVTLVALSGIVLLFFSVFRSWAKYFYGLGFEDGMKAQASHDSLCREEMIEDIKSDLEKYRAEQDNKETFHFLRMNMCDDFAKMIEKHISGKEKDESSN